MKKWFLKIEKAVDGTDMYVSEGFSLDEEQRCALCFDTKEEAEDYAMEMPDDDVVVVEEEIIQAAQFNQKYNNAIQGICLKLRIPYFILFLRHFLHLFI